MPSFMNLPGYEFPRNALLDTSGMSSAIDDLGKTLKENRLREQDVAIGNRLATGDYAGGAAKAFELGKLDTGLGIKKFATAEATAEEERHHKIIQRMAGAAQSALEEKDPVRQGEMFKKFMAIPGVTNALPKEYHADPKLALGYIVNSAREVGDELKMRYKSQLEQEGRFERGRALGLIPPSGGATPSVSTVPSAPATSRTDPRTLRTNNPGAIEYGAFAKSMGAIGSDGRYAIFPDSETGYRAMDHLLGIYTGRGQNTIASIIGGTPDNPKRAWASALVDNNSTKAYIASVARTVGLNPNAPIPPELMPRVAEAMAAYEAGRPVPRASGLPPTQVGPAAQFTQVPGTVVEPQGSVTEPPAVTPSAPLAPPPSAAATATAAVPTDPYLRLTQPAISREQEEAERKRRAAIEFYGGDEKQAAKIMAKEEELKEYQTKDASFAEQMGRSEITLRDIMGQNSEKYNPGRIRNNLWFDTSLWNSSDWKSYQATALEWIMARLRKVSGATITETEFDRDFRTYFPQPGEDLNVQKLKFDRRVQAARGMRASSGPAFDRLFPNFDTEMRQRLIDQDPTRYGTGEATDDSIQVLTPEEARQQPPGTVFRTKDGRIKRVPGGTPVRGHQ